MNGSVESFELGLLVECRRTAGGDATWRTGAVVAAVPDALPLRLLRDDGRTALYLSSPHSLELHRTSCESYRYNLEAPQPSLFAVLRQGPDETWAPTLVTAAPDEAQAHMDSGDEVVDAVPLPAELKEQIEAFVARSPPEQFRKRQRDR